jgi:hypothetical protein
MSCAAVRKRRKREYTRHNLSTYFSSFCLVRSCERHLTIPLLLLFLLKQLTCHIQRRLCQRTVIADLTDD